MMNSDAHVGTEISCIYKTCFKTHSVLLQHHYRNVLAEVERTQLLYFGLLQIDDLGLEPRTAPNLL